MSKEHVKLSVFIVPNSITKLGYVCLSKVGGTHIWDRDVTQLNRVSAFGFNPRRGDKFVQVWILNPEEGDRSNWTDHSIPEEYQKYFNDECYAPSYIPLKDLSEVKEGDERVLFNNDEVEITLKFEQLPYRYARFGKFEDAVKSLVSSYIEEADDDWNKTMGNVIPISGNDHHWTYTD